LDVAERIGGILADAASEGRGLLEIEATSSGQAAVNGSAFAEFPIAVFLAPGEYEVAASFPTGPRLRQVSLRTGKVTTVELEAPSVQPPVAIQAFAPRAGLATGALAAQRWRLPAYGVLGGSAAALAVGTLFGAMANANQGRLVDRRGELTVNEGLSLAATANRQGLTANLLWTVGSVGALTGGALLVMSMPEPGVKR
jgi:hypothetical protein